MKERREYASMGFMYEFQKKNNPPQKRVILSDKIKFFDAYKEFLGRSWMNPLLGSVKDIAAFIAGKEKIVLKGSTGGGGKNVKILRIAGNTPEKILQLAQELHFDILEEFVYQHDDLQRLAPNSLNTVRFITQLDQDGGVDIIGASLRMGIYKNTDNLSSGGITAKINVETGVIESDGVSFDITLPDYKVHPVSNMKIQGFRVPYWKEVRQLCVNATSKYGDNKSIGWDVAIKQDGPILIEGNHDWGARVWQMPAGTGLKKILSKYI
jgi:putative hexapeptide transferase family protein